VDVAAIFHETLDSAINPPRPDTLITSVPREKSELPQLHFREVKKNSPGETSWVVILRDEFGVVHDQIPASVVENRAALEQRFRHMWSDLLQNRSHAHMARLKTKDDDETSSYAEDIEPVLKLAKDTLNEGFSEVSIEYNDVKVTLRK